MPGAHGKLLALHVVIGFSAVAGVSRAAAPPHAASRQASRGPKDGCMVALLATGLWQNVCGGGFLCAMVVCTCSV